MQDGAIFMQRVEFLLKTHISLSTFWWRGEITGETARIPKAKSSVSNIYSYDYGLKNFLQWHNSCWVVGEYKYLSFTAGAHKFEEEQPNFCLLQSIVIYLRKMPRLYFEQLLTNLNDHDILLHQERKINGFWYGKSDYSVLLYKQVA